MEERDIEVVLVHIEYDYVKKTKEYKVKELSEIDSSDYPFYVKVGPWRHGGELLTQLYLKAKVEGSYQDADIAVKMPKEQADSVKEVTTQPKGYAYQRYADEQQGMVYFTPPRKGGITGHYTAGGSETIQISFADGRKEWMRLVAKVDEEARDSYRELVRDLVFMEQKLCIDDKSSMSMAVKWAENMYEETKSLVMDFCAAFDRLKGNARPELKPFRTKESFHKIKKPSSRALIEHEIFHKEKVSAISYREDLDTFEHRVIKNHLHLLKNLVKIRRNMDNSALANERARIQRHLDLSENELEERKRKLKEDMDKNIENWERRPKESEALGLMPVYIQFHVRDDFEQEQGILEFWHFSKKSNGWPEIFVKCFQDVPDSASRRQITDIVDVECRHKIWEGKEKGWSDWKEYKIPGAGGTKYIHISAPMYCTEAAAGLFHYLQSDERIIEKGSVVGICGTVAASKYRKVREKDGRAEFQFQFQDIYFVSLFDQEEGKICDAERVRYPVSGSGASEEEKRQRREEFHEFLRESDNLVFYEEALDKIKDLEELDSQIRDERKRKRRWTSLEKKLSEREKTPFMKAVKSVRTPIQNSNLFTFHPDYRKIYAVMQADARKMEGVEYCLEDPEDEFSVADLPHLYEVWTCLNLVNFFVENYEFKLLNTLSEEYEAGEEILKEYIREILKGGELCGSQFQLKGNVGGQTMTVTIGYNCRFPLDAEKLKTGGYYAKRKRDGELLVRKSLAPDIAMRMQMGEKDCIFILDAKCKGRNCDGIQELCETAFQKYTWELGNGMILERAPDFVQSAGKQIERLFLPNFIQPAKRRIDGSFIILHSCTEMKETLSVNEGGKNNKKIEVTYDPQNYLGAYPDELARHLWKGKCEENKWEVSTEGLTKWAEWFPGEDNHENRLGIVAANPKTNNLPNFLQMIMERYFGAYRARCWLCGSVDLEIKQKMTQGNFPKYHIRCRNCKKCTVENHCANGDCHHTKLGKHYDNYFAQQKKQKEDKGVKGSWNVSCPRCRKLAPSENGSEATSEKIAPLPARDFSPPPWEPFRGRGS